MGPLAVGWSSSGGMVPLVLGWSSDGPSSGGMVL